MNTKMLLAALAGAIVSFLLGWLFYGFLLMDFFQSNQTQYEGLMKEMPNLLFIFIANLSTAFLVAFIFDRWANIRTFSKGLLAGLLIGFLVTLSYDFYFIASINLMTPAMVAVDIVVASIMTAIMGGVIALILGTGKK